VVFSLKRRGEFREARREHVDPSGLVRRQMPRAADNVKRGAPFRPGFDQYEAPARKVERRQAVFAGRLGIARPPSKPAGNHQVNHEPQVAVQSDGNPLAEPPQLGHATTVAVLDRRIDGSQHERARHPHPFERLAKNSPLEGR
jgi:hypothetical protein